MPYVVEKDIFTNRQGTKHYILSIRNKKEDKVPMVSFGKRKARAIVDNINAIKIFLKEEEEEEKEEK